MRVVPLPTLVALGAALATAACGKPKPAGEPALCRITTSIAASKPLHERTVPAPFWFHLLVRGYQTSGAIARPARDCEGQYVSWNADSCAADTDVAKLEPEPLDDRDVVVSHLGDARRLVWVQTDRYVNGEAVGPVALAVFDASGISVTTLGTLRAYASRAQLRMEKLGEGQILVAEGEACSDEKDARTCVRGIRIVPVGRRRFVPLAISETDGRCQGRSFFPLRAEGILGEGPRRKSYRIQSSVTFAPDALTVQESLTIGPPQTGSVSADATASAVSRLTAERKIRFTGGRLVAEGPSLFERWARQLKSAEN